MSSESEEEFDQDVQNILLEQLDRYADSFMENGQDERKTKSNKRKEKLFERKLPTNSEYSSKEKMINRVKPDVKHAKVKSVHKKACSDHFSKTVTTVATKSDKKLRDSAKVKPDNETNLQEKSVGGNELNIDIDMDIESTKKNRKNKKKFLDECKIFPESEILPAKKSKNEDIEDLQSDDDIDFEDFSDHTDSELGDIDNLETDEGATKSNSSSVKHLEDFKKKLGLTEKDFAEYTKRRKCTECSNQANTKAVLTIGGKKRPPPEVIVFEDPAKRSKKEAKVKNKTIGRKQALQDFLDQKQHETAEFDLISAKYEVHKFGIEGLDQLSKEEAKVQMLIKLGAKPQKKKCINYKELMKQKKEEQEKKKQAQSVDKHYLGPTSTVSGKSKKKKGKGGKNNSDFGDGQMGKYKHGVQFIKTADIQKVKSTKSHNRKR